MNGGVSFYEGEVQRVVEILDVCIVDSSVTWRHAARDVLCKELEMRGIHACVDEFSAPEAMGATGEQTPYDVILADISDARTRIPYLDYYRELCLTCPQTKLIFLSDDPWAALDVFECDPDYFVYKLELESRLRTAIRFVLQSRQGVQDSCLIVVTRSARYVLSMREILYCEHAQRQTKIVTSTRVVTCSEKLNEIYQRLDPAQFVQTHCSFLVNLRYVKELRRTGIVLKTGACIPLSRANRAGVQQALAEYLSHAELGDRPPLSAAAR